MTSRPEIEKEVKEDLAKSDVHLLVDVHEEILRKDRSLPENLIHAQKRIASLFARSAIESRKSIEENNKLQKEIRNMTWWLKWFTILLFFIALIQLYLAIKP
jgi:hypothetical protein